MITHITVGTVASKIWLSPLETATTEPSTSVPSSDEVVAPSRFESLDNWIAAGIILAIGIAVGFGCRHLIRRWARKNDSVTSTVQIVSQLVALFIIAVALAVALGTIGVDLGPVLAGAGIVGITFGFALKDIAENYVAGVIMGFSNPFSPGDHIIVDEGNIEGTVEELQLRYTVIRGSDGVRILMPNSIVLKSPVENLTTNGRRRSTVKLKVNFGADIDTAIELALETIGEVDGVRQDPKPEGFVERVGAKTVTLRLRFWHRPSPHDGWVARSAVLDAVSAAFSDAGILHSKVHHGD